MLPLTSSWNALSEVLLIRKVPSAAIRARSFAPPVYSRIRPLAWLDAMDSPPDRLARASMTAPSWTDAPEVVKLEPSTPTVTRSSAPATSFTAWNTAAAAAPVLPLYVLVLISEFEVTDCVTVVELTRQP